MRRCKYFYKTTWFYNDYITNQKKEAGAIQCTNKKLVYVWDGINTLPCLLEGSCPYYTPVEIDPYWKGIIDETNRRLNNE